MGNTKALILVHHAMERVFLSDTVNIMLTAEFYTLKKERIPVKYTYQAKAIAPSLFDGLLEEGQDYEYMVWKEEDEWTFIAYDVAQIATFLESKGFALSQVAKIFFVQQSLALFDGVMPLGEDKALLAIDSVVVLLPLVVLPESQKPSLVFSNRFTPKKGVSLQSTHHSLLSFPQSLTLAILLSVFTMIFAFDAYTLTHLGGEEEEILLQLEEEYPKLISPTRRKSILAKYQKIDKQERQKRDKIKLLSSMIFKGVTLSSLSLEKDTIKASFSCENSKVSQRIKALAKKHHFKSRSISGSHDLIVEGSL